MECAREDMTGDAGQGRLPLAVAVVDGQGAVSHWSSGARRLFGRTQKEAVGAPAVELMPVAGAFGESAYPVAGRARTADPGEGSHDVLWWAYPLIGPGPERLLVLAADAARLRPGGEGAGDGAGGGEFERIAPAFALHTDFPGADGLARGLPVILPGMNAVESARIASQVLELGYPVLEFSRHERVPVTSEWGVPRRVAHRSAPVRAVTKTAGAVRTAAGKTV